MALTSDELLALVRKPKVVEVDGLKTQQHNLRDVLDADDRIRSRESTCNPAQRIRGFMA